MLTAFAPEKLVKEGIDALDISTETLAFISGKNASRLSRGFRGLLPFDGGESEYLLGLVRELREAASDALPFRLPEEPSALKNLLDDRRTSKQRQKQEDVVSLRVSGRWFMKRNSNGSLSLALNVLSAAPMIRSVADEVAERLQRTGFVVSVSQNPYQDTDLTVGLKEVWSE